MELLNRTQDEGVGNKDLVHLDMRSGLRTTLPRVSNFSLSSKSRNSSEAGGHSLQRKVSGTEHMLVGEIGQIETRADVAERYRKGVLSIEAKKLVKELVVDENQYLKTD